MSTIEFKTQNFSLQKKTKTTVLFTAQK